MSGRRECENGVRRVHAEGSLRRKCARIRLKPLQNPTSPDPSRHATPGAPVSSPQRLFLVRRGPRRKTTQLRRRSAKPLHRPNVLCRAKEFDLFRGSLEHFLRPAAVRDCCSLRTRRQRVGTREGGPVGCAGGAGDRIAPAKSLARPTPIWAGAAGGGARGRRECWKMGRPIDVRGRRRTPSSEARAGASAKLRPLEACDGRRASLSSVAAVSCPPWPPAQNHPIATQVGCGAPRGEFRCKCPPVSISRWVFGGSVEQFLLAAEGRRQSERLVRVPNGTGVLLPAGVCGV